MRYLKSSALLLAFLLTLSACGGGIQTPQAAAGGSDVTLYDCGGLQAALPSEYTDLLTVSNASRFESAAEEQFLLSVSEKASVEAAEKDFGSGDGFGYLFGLAVVDQAGLEQLLCMDYPGTTVFATDGERYYLYTEPTDVQFYRSGGEIRTESEDWKTWEKLNELGPQVREDFLTRNNLQSFTVQDYASQLAADSGDHLCMKYYPYYLKDGDTRAYDTLLLCQPARQGEGGIWAVDQWFDVYGSPYFYFPDSGLPAAEYYARLQEQCDAGEHPEYLTPAGAAAAFAETVMGHETTENSFEETPGVNYDYMTRNRELEQLALDIMFEEKMDGLTLLDTLALMQADNWGVLGRNMYGSDWFVPLMNAVDSAAIGTEQQRRDEAVLSILLATADAQTDFGTPLNDVLKRQKEADPEAFNAALEAFPEGTFFIGPGTGRIYGRIGGWFSEPVDIDVPTY